MEPTRTNNERSAEAERAMERSTTVPIGVVATGLVSVLFALVGCGDSTDGLALPALDRTQFRRQIEPLVAEECGNPTTCHGDTSRPYELYVRNANRLNPADVYRDPPLTDTEHRLNYARSRSFAVERPAGPELLTKPLAESLGGIPHDGDDIFTSLQDRDYRRLSDWLETAKR